MSVMGYRDEFGYHSCLTEEEISKLKLKPRKKRIKIIMSKKNLELINNMRLKIERENQEKSVVKSL